MKAAVLLRSLYAAEPFRFGAMFGSYVFNWKMALHLLRLYNPGPKGKRRTEVWHAPFAGALSGLAVLTETKNSRIGIAQQTFVRQVSSSRLFFSSKADNIPVIEVACKDGTTYFTSEVTSIYRMETFSCLEQHAVRL